MKDHLPFVLVKHNLSCFLNLCLLGARSFFAQINAFYSLLQPKTNVGLSLLGFRLRMANISLLWPNLDWRFVASQRYVKDSNALPNLKRKKRHWSNSNIWHECRMESYSMYLLSVFQKQGNNGTAQQPTWFVGVGSAHQWKVTQTNTHLEDRDSEDLWELTLTEYER